MTLHQLLRGPRRSPAGAPTPTWHVSITIDRLDDEVVPAISTIVRDSAATLGVEIETRSSRLDARFLVRADALREATESGFERWEEICQLLSLPSGPCSSIVVTSEAADVQVPRAPTIVPGHRFPYCLWSAG